MNEIISQCQICDMRPISVIEEDVMQDTGICWDCMTSPKRVIGNYIRKKKDV